MSFLAFARNLIRDSPGLVLLNAGLLVLTSLIGVLAAFSVAPVVDIISDPSLQDVSGITESIVTRMRAVGLPVSAVSVLGLFVALHALKSCVL